MEAVYKVSLLLSITLMCLIQLSASNDPYDLELLLGPPGNECSSYFGCNKKHTRCMERLPGCSKVKTCECKDGYILDWDADICVQFREVDSKCTLGEDICPPGSACINSKCTCASGIHSKDKEVCGRRHGETCTADSECNQVRGPQTCLNGVCECGPGTEYKEEMGKKCLPNTGNTCTLNNECYSGQVCDANACRCPTGQKFDVDTYQCVGSNALTNVALAEECTESKTTTNAKICAFGLTCFACNPTLGIWRCADIPTSAGTQPVQAVVLMFVAVLTALMV